MYVRILGDQIIVHGFGLFAILQVQGELLLGAHFILILGVSFSKKVYYNFYNYLYIMNNQKYSTDIIDISFDKRIRKGWFEKFNR